LLDTGADRGQDHRDRSASLCIECSNDKETRVGKKKEPLDNPSMIPPKVREILILHWLPRVREVREQRRPLQRLMIGILLLPLGGAILGVIYQFGQLRMGGAVGWVEATTTTALLGMSAISFVYVGKIQACSDLLLQIEFAVYIGERELLSRAIEHLTCFSNRGILDDVRGLIHGHGPAATS
jgi:hypothetical protein